MNYFFHLLIVINIYIIISLSTNLLVGMTNLISLGQAALYGIGAYLTAFALTALHLPLIPCMIFVIVLNSLISLLIAYPSLRLKGDYFLLASIAFQLIVYTILYNWISVTKGPYGIIIPAPKIFGLFQLSGIIPLLILSTTISMLTVFVIYRLIHSPFGRILKGIRSDEIAVSALGRDVTRNKIFVFMISSGFIGIAGFVFAVYVNYIDAHNFDLNEAIFILAAVLIGGTGNIKGPVIGSVFVILLPEALRFIGLPSSVAADLRQIIYGLTIIVLMRYRPQGLAGEYWIK